MCAAVVAAGADNLDLVRNALAVCAAILFLVRRGTAARRISAFLGSVGHGSSSTPERLPVCPVSMLAASERMQQQSFGLSGNGARHRDKLKQKRLELDAHHVETEICHLGRTRRSAA